MTIVLIALFVNSAYADWEGWQARAGDKSCVLVNTYRDQSSSAYTQPVRIVDFSFAQGISEANMSPELVELGYASQELLVFILFWPGFDSHGKIVGAKVDDAATDVVDMNDTKHFYLGPKPSGQIMSALSAEAQVVITASDESGRKYEFTLPNERFSVNRAMFEACNAAFASMYSR